jgi:alpha-galactosidase
VADVERWTVEAAWGLPLPPLGFLLDGRPSTEVLPGRRVDAGSAGPRRSWTDPASGLAVSVDLEWFDGFAAVEWVARFANHGAADSPVLSEVAALDIGLPLPWSVGCRVHHARGSECRRDDFAPLVDPLGPDGANPQAPRRGPSDPVVIASKGGRSSCGALPFLNLERDDGSGMIVAIGWTGDWEARTWRGEDGAVRIRAGMQRTHLRLHPGEEIRTPRILLLAWDGSRDDGQNELRRFLLAHHAPRRGRAEPRVPVSFVLWGEVRAERQIAKARWFSEQRMPIDNFWIDAGWHGDAPVQVGANVFNSGWWRQVGNWWPNPGLFPQGFSPVGDAARAGGRDFTVWFEPERVREGTVLTREHPEWLLGPRGGDFLFDLGNPEARQAMTDLIVGVIAEGRISCYRQDFNMDITAFWQAADAPDRVGMAEIRHIEGLYAFWDALLARFPGLLIDNCSSGGRRIDLETLSRSIPLWRSDVQCYPGFDPIGMQAQTHGLSPWVPLSSGACDTQDRYALRSTLGPGLVMTTRIAPEGHPEGMLPPWEAYDPDWLRAALEEERAVQPFFLGDFHPLLSYSLADDAWVAWQFDRPDLGAGVLIAFRRQHSPFPSMNARLRSLEADSRYEVTDRDDGSTRAASGRELMETGFEVRIGEAPGSRLLFYRRV